MKIVVGSVVKGFALKSAVKQYLEQNGHEVVDVGCYDTSIFAKFPSIAERAARVLQKGEADLGVLCCGSGTGMALAVGKFKGICAICRGEPACGGVRQEGQRCQRRVHGREPCGAGHGVQDRGDIPEDSVPGRARGAGKDSRVLG